MIHKKSRKKIKSLKGGVCTKLNDVHLFSQGYAHSRGVPLNILDLCRVWVNGGNTVCIAEGKRQIDTLYLSKGPTDNFYNHIHLYDFNNPTGYCGVKDKFTNDKGGLVIKDNNIVSICYKFHEMLSNNEGLSRL